MDNSSILRSAAGYTVVSNKARLMLSRKIFLEGSITNETACEIIQRIMILASEDDSAPIDLLINSPGGEWRAGLLLVDAIETSPVPIRLFCLGRAYSMAAILFASGTHGRFMLPRSSQLMLHEPLLGDGIAGSTSSIKTVAETLGAVKRQMIKLLSDRTGRTEAEIEEVSCSEPKYFDPVQSIEFGLADSVVGLDELWRGTAWQLIN